jgi:protease IV
MNENMEQIQNGGGCGKNVFMSSVGCSLLSIAIVPVLCLSSMILLAFSGQTIDQVYSVNTIQSGNKDKIAVINIDGVIMDIEDGLHTASMFEYTMSALDDINQNDDIKAVIVRMNTPGGGVYESARIEEKINELQANDKTVVSVVESVSASGGYWIAASTDRIYIQPESITGSIGVLFQNIEYAELLNKIGLKEVIITNKEGINKVPQKLSDENNPQRKQLEDLLAENFNLFVDVIVDGRGLSREQVMPHADGRILSGMKAVEFGLADEIGGYVQALDYLETEYNIVDPTIIEYEWFELVGFGSFWSQLQSSLDFGSRYGKAGGQVLAIPEYMFEVE